MQKKVTVVDYGLGNIFSVKSAFLKAGCLVEIATTAQQIMSAKFLVLPGVGAFKTAMQELSNKNFIQPIKEFAHTGKPLLGICLGMQLLFESSEENGDTQGLGLMPGKIVRIVPEKSPIKVPHMGWSQLHINPSHPDAKQTTLCQTIANNFAYFVHSYHPLLPQEHLFATSLYYGHVIHAMVKKDNLLGCQFHPEKSGDKGIQFLSAL